MGKDEKIIMSLAFVALVGILIYNKGVPGKLAVVGAGGNAQGVLETVGISASADTQVGGPSYLTYNLPYAFSPPVGNFLPSRTVGMVGATVPTPADFAKTYTDCGCNS